MDLHEFNVVLLLCHIFLQQSTKLTELFYSQGGGAVKLADCHLMGPRYDKRRQPGYFGAYIGQLFHSVP